MRIVDAEYPHALRRSSGRICSSAPSTGRASRRSRSRRDRCPRTSSAGSRRTAPCRRAGGGTTRGARSRTGGPASTGRRCRARSRCRCARAARTRRRKSSAVPELGVDGLVAAFPRADGPRAPRVARTRGGGVVASLAPRDADRVDRGKVQDVEAQVRDVGEARLAVLERAVTRAGRRAGKHLVPALKRARGGSTVTVSAGSLTVSQAAVGIPRDERVQPRVRARARAARRACLHRPAPSPRP